ncbi:hypothetical protein D3C85_664210 [compost metagenome]
MLLPAQPLIQRIMQRSVKQQPRPYRLHQQAEPGVLSQEVELSLDQFIPLQIFHLIRQYKSGTPLQPMEVAQHQAQMLLLP